MRRRILPVLWGIAVKGTDPVSWLDASGETTTDPLEAKPFGTWERADAFRRRHCTPPEAWEVRQLPPPLLPEEAVEPLDAAA